MLVNAIYCFGLLFQFNIILPLLLSHYLDVRQSIQGQGSRVQLKACLSMPASIASFGRHEVQVMFLNPFVQGVMQAVQSSWSSNSCSSYTLTCF